MKFFQKMALCSPVLVSGASTADMKGMLREIETLAKRITQLEEESSMVEMNEVVDGPGICTSGQFSQSELDTKYAHVWQEKKKNNPDISHFYMDPHIAASGVCHGGLDSFCRGMCNAMPDCTHFSYSSTVPCKACFVHKSCDTVATHDIYSGYKHQKLIRQPRYPTPAMPCNHELDTPKAACSLGTEEPVRIEGCWSCSERMKWLEDTRGFEEPAAKKEIFDEFPQKCCKYAIYR